MGKKKKEKERETGISIGILRVYVVPRHGISRAALNQEDIKLLVERLLDKRIDCSAMQAALKHVYRLSLHRRIARERRKIIAKKVRLSSFVTARKQKEKHPIVPTMGNPRSTRNDENRY